jgi:hypothetical protein
MRGRSCLEVRGGALEWQTWLIRPFSPLDQKGSMMTSSERVAKDALVLTVVVAVLAAVGGLFSVLVKAF